MGGGQFLDFFGRTQLLWGGPPVPDPSLRKTLGAFYVHPQYPWVKPSVPIRHTHCSREGVLYLWNTPPVAAKVHSAD